MQSAKQNWNAEDYAKNSSAQLEWARELIAKLSLQGNESLLDIGCGDGKITAQLASFTAGHVLGIDSSTSMIHVASERFPSISHPNLSFVQMDAADIRLSERFDIAFSNAVLHWVEDHISVLRGTRGCLNSGGKLLFQMGGHGNAGGMFYVVQEVVRRSRWKMYYEDFASPYHFYGPEEYQAWLSQCGFHSARIELIPKDMRHQGKKGLMGWLRTTWFPYTDRLPVELRGAFLDEVVETYTAAYPVSALGETHIKMVRLEVEAYAL